MVKLGTFNIPTSWFDITVDQFNLLQDEKDENKVISILTGIDEWTFDHLSQKNQYQLSLLLSFIASPFDFDSIEVENIKDIKKETFGQKVLLQQHLATDNHDLSTIVAIYSDNFDIDKLDERIKEVNKMPITYVYPLAKNYIEQITRIVNIENETLAVQPTSEQVRAGLSMFEEFGIMNTIRALADGNILNYDKILKIDYNTVYLHLKMSKCETMFQRNYQKIMSKK